MAAIFGGRVDVVVTYDPENGFQFQSGSLGGGYVLGLEGNLGGIPLGAAIEGRAAFVVGSDLSVQFVVEGQARLGLVTSQFVADAYWRGDLSTGHDPSLVGSTYGSARVPTNDLLGYGPVHSGLGVEFRSGFEYNALDQIAHEGFYTAVRGGYCGPNPYSQTHYSPSNPSGDGDPRNDNDWRLSESDWRHSSNQPNWGPSPIQKRPTVTPLCSTDGHSRVVCCRWPC